MSDQEQKLDSLISKFDKHCEYVTEELSQIKRGVYGDKGNNVPGLIDRQSKDERRLTKLEELNKKILWIGLGIYIAVQSIIVLVYKLFL